MESRIKALAEAIKTSRKTVFFGGAGTSTASGIPDFRSSTGLYQTEFEGMSPEVILSRSFFYADPGKFYRFLRGHMYFPEAGPNDCHLVLAQMEEMGLLHSVITQNIDGLHQQAGSRRVIELHGNMGQYRCDACGKPFGIEALGQTVQMEPSGRRGQPDQADVPLCSCGGLLKPEVTLYEEMLDESVVEGAVEAIATADVLIIGGTSLSVYPAAGFIRYFSGRLMVVMNQSPTQADERAGLVFREPIDQVMAALLEELQQ